jgi:hypothetical protein
VYSQTTTAPAVSPGPIDRRGTPLPTELEFLS